MRVLVLSSTPWAESNSFGNSFSNIFEGISGLEFANIYCLHGSPDNTLVRRYLQITEGSLLTNIWSPSVPTGRSFLGACTDFGEVATPEVNDAEREPRDLPAVGRKALDFMRSRRWQVFFWARDLIWKFGRWESPELRAFIDDFAPDVIFQPIYYSNYMSDIALFIHRYAGVPMVGYISDDNYTLRQFSMSPLYWVDRLYKRRKVKRVIGECEYLYVISRIQQEEYERCFRKHCEILTKCADFRDRPLPASGPEYPRTPDHPVQLLYTGNIGAGRWRSLALVVSALRQINVSGTKAQLAVYTATPITAAMKRALDVGGTSQIMGSVSAARVAQLQKDADILVHAEGLSLSSRLLVRQSFSTKIVDYLTRSRCILAVGPRDVASIDYFVRNDAAAVAHDAKQVVERLRALVEDPSYREEYGRKAWDCGKRNHSREAVQRKLYSDLCRILTPSRMRL